MTTNLLEPVAKPRSTNSSKVINNLEASAFEEEIQKLRAELEKLVILKILIICCNNLNIINLIFFKKHLKNIY